MKVKKFSLKSSVMCLLPMSDSMNFDEQKKNGLFVAFSSSDEVKQNVFSKDEIAGANMIPEKKRSEHFAGILALRRAVVQCYPNAETIDVERRRNAPPIVRVDGMVLTSISLSVSHSHGYAFAAIMNAVTSIGVDIQKIEGFVLTSTQILSQEEQGRSPRHSMVLLWAYKEALSKALRVGLRVHPKRMDIQLNEAGNLIGARIDNISLSVVGVQYEQIPGLVSVLVVLTDNRIESLLRNRETSYYGEHG